MIELLILAAIIAGCVMTQRAMNRIGEKLDAYEEYLKEIETNVYNIYNKKG